MYKCINCKNQNLERIRYENAMIWRCPDCKGTLLESKRAEQIKRKNEIKNDALHNELNTNNSTDTLETISCLKCHTKMIKKLAIENQRAHFRSDMKDFYIDICTYCDLIWFDGGELASLQLNYESSRKGRENLKHYIRYSDLNQQQKEDYIKTVAGSIPDQVKVVADIYINEFSNAIDDIDSAFNRINDK